jgi:O-methyltransferase involved in polyketide biosynthesis
MPEPTSAQEPLIRNTSETVRWAAIHRVVETDRPDALFRDPIAGCLTRRFCV